MGGCASRPKELDATTDAPTEAPATEVENVSPESKNEGEKEALLSDLSQPKAAEGADEAKPEAARPAAAEEPAKEAEEKKAPSNESKEEKAKPEAAPTTENKTEAPLVTV